MASVNWFDDDEQEGKDDAPKTGISTNWFEDESGPATDSNVKKKSAFDPKGEAMTVRPTEEKIDELEPEAVGFGDQVWNIAQRGFAEGLKSFPALMEGLGIISKHTGGATVGDVQMMGGEAQFPMDAPTDDPNDPARKIEEQSKSAIISAARQIKEWLPKTPERVKMSGVMKVIDDAVVGQAHYANVMVAGAANKFAAFPAAYLTILPDKYNQYVDEDNVDPEHAYLVASTAAAPLALVESLSEVTQIGKWKGAFKKVVDKTAEGPAKKILGAIWSGGKTEATEEWVQGAIELAFDIWAANPDKSPGWIAEEYWRVFKTPEFQAGNAYGAVVGAVGGGGMGGGMQAAGVTYNGLRKKMSGTKDVDPGQDTTVVKSEDGTTVIAPVTDENSTSHNIKDVGDSTDRPTVDHLMGAAEDGRARVPDQTVDGASVSLNPNVTTQQAKETISSNETMKSILAKVEVNGNMKKADQVIKASEEKLASLEEFYQIDMEKGDHEGALRTAEMMQQTAQTITAGYQTFQTNYLKQLEQKKLLPEPNEFVDMDLHVQKINQRAQQAVAAQKSALNNLRIQEQQVYMDTLGTRQGLESDLMTESVKASRTGRSEASKVYSTVLQEMKMLSHQGPWNYFRGTSVDKLMKLKLKIETQALNDQQDSKGSIEEDRTAIRNDAMKSWINNTLMERAEYDDIQLTGDRFVFDAKVEEQRAKAEAQARVAQQQAAKGAIDTQKINQAEKERQAKVQAQEEQYVAQKAKEAAAKKATVQAQASTLRKPVPGETRAKELEKNKQDKKARELEISRQRQAVEGQPKKGTTKVADLKKKENEFVILTSDNPGSKTASKADNVRNRSNLIKELDRLGISYTIGRSKFEGKPEVPFIIHGMTRAEGKKLSDRLGQSSFIHAKGDETALIEGDKVAPGKRDSIKMNPNATDFYTEINGEKFTMDFDFGEQQEETKAAITDKKEMAALLSTPEIAEAYGDIKVDAIGEKDTTTPVGSIQVTILKGSPSAEMAGNSVNLETDGRRDFKEQLDEKVRIIRDKRNSLLDTEQMQMSEPVSRAAKGLFRAAAIRYDGKVYEGTSHIGIIMANNNLDKLLMDKSFDMNKLEDGFVTHEGVFVSREQATKLVNKTDGEVLYSEDFLHEVLNQRHSNNKLMSADGFAKMTLKGKMGTLEIMDALQEKMLAGKYSWLFRRTAKSGLKTIFITNDGQYGKLDIVKKTYPNLKDRENAIKAFEGDMAVNPRTGGMMKRGGVKGSYLPGMHTAIINIPNLSSVASNLDQAMETVVHEHVHGLVKVAFDSMTPVQKMQVTAELKDLWASLGTEFKRHLRDNPETHPRVRIGIEQIDKSLGEFITYSMAHPEFASWLDSIPASPKFRAKSSKIKSMWDALVNIVRNVVRPKYPTVLDEVTDVLNRHLKLGQAEARFSLDDEFNFGANVSPEFVSDWAKELDNQAANALPTVVANDKADMEEKLGFQVADNTKAIWTSDGKLMIRADMIESQDEFVSTWMHEQVAHQGLRNVFGNNKALFNRFLDQAFTLFSIKESALVTEMAALYNVGFVKNGKLTLTKKEKRLVAEEMIARKAEKMKPVTKKGLVTRFKEFLKRWLPARFVDVQTEFTMTEADIMDILSMARENVLVGTTSFGDMLTKALEQRRPKHTFQGWETLPEFIESDETYLKWAAEVLDKAPELKKWYSQHVETIAENFGKDKDLFNILLAITSPQADVETNVQFAIDTYAYMMGLVDKPGALFPNVLKERIDTKWTSPDAMLSNLESKNFKVTEFGRALLGDPSATVGDLWMFRLFYGDHAVFNKDAETYSVGQITGLRQKLHSLAAQMTEKTGETWTPREMQAALWTYVNAKQTGKEIKQVASYQSGLNRPSPMYGDMTPLQWLNKAVPNLKDGPLSDKVGISEVPLAPVSPLQKKLVEQQRKELGKKGGFAVDVVGNINVSYDGMDNLAMAQMVTALGKGGIEFTAKTQEQASWYQKMFGFESVDGLTMRLGSTARDLFSDGKGNIKPNLVRDNIGGFSGAYTRVARFSLAARENLDKIANMSQEEINNMDAEFIRTGNDGTSVVNKIHEWRDSAGNNMDRFTSALEQEFLEKFGGRKSRLLKLGSGRRLNTADTELLQKAMNLYIDSGTGSNLDKVKAYIKKLADKGMKNLTGKEYQQLDIMERMLALTEEEKAWADDAIRPYYEDFFTFAQEHKLIDSHVDNYVKRMWKRPDSLKDDAVIWSGGTTSGFKLVSNSGKQRTFDSIVDGWEAGMSLQAEGVISNLSAYGSEIGYTFANRRFVEYMRSMIDFKTDGLMFEVDPKKDPDFKPGPNYIQITSPGFAKPFHKLYAMKEIGNQINRIGRTASHQIWDVPFVRFLRRMNASIKSTLLSVSLFHHLAGMRSYIYGVSGVHVNGIKAYKQGLDKIAKQTEFTDENLKKLGPMIDFLVKEGLTLGKTQDWDESVMQESFLEDFLSNRTGKPSRKLLEAWQYARRKKRAFTTGLFNRLFAGLKAEAASMEFIHSVKKQEAKLGRFLTDAELKLTGQQSAAIVNADFGGLHLQRMGRNPDLQRVAQMLLLAPDWTESNWRTVTGMVPGLNNKINKLIGDNPEVAGMNKVYRRFWGGVAVKGLFSVALAQAAVLGLMADDKEREDYWDFMADQFSSFEQFSKGRWVSLDFTPVARMLGVGDPEKRQVFSILGHFKDVLKIFDPWALIKHKISPAVKLIESGVTMTDWKDSRFTSIKELIEDGTLVAEGGKFASDIKGIEKLSQIPSWAIYNLRGAAPIPMGEVFQVVQGESSPLASGARMVGLDVRDVTEHTPGQRKYEEINSEINELDRNLKEAQTIGDRRMIVEARKDIRRYDNFNRKKSQIGFTRAQLRPVNKEIKRLTLIQESDKGLTTSQERQLAREKKKQRQIYERFLKVIER